MQISFTERVAISQTSRLCLRASVVEDVGFEVQIYLSVTSGIGDVVLSVPRGVAGCSY